MSELWLARRLSKLSKRIHDHRSPFQRDRARILHSAAFRRLQSKTQVMGNKTSDFYRTRLTHSLEAAQIGSGIVAQLKTKSPDTCASLLPQDDTLIESICLAHDIGHPPFGHGGEVALHYMMRDHGGFEGNGQTLRIVAKLEPFSESHGMNLTRRTLLGLLKYPQVLSKLTLHQTELPDNFRQITAEKWHPAKGIYDDDKDVLDWILLPLNQEDKTLFQHYSSKLAQHGKTCFKSLDCSIMELADDIAYGIHDLEDAIVTGVINRSSFEENVIKKLSTINDPWVAEHKNTLADSLFSEKRYQQKDSIGALVNYLITSIELHDLNETQSLSFSEPLLKFNAKLPPNAAAVLQIFKDFVYDFVIKQTSIQRLEYRGQQIVMELFEAMASDPMRLLPLNTAKRWADAKASGLNEYRIIADYVSGMTDDYATKLYHDLFMPDIKS